MHWSHLAYLDWNYLWVKIDTKYLDYFIEMIEHAVLQAEFVSKGYLPNLRAICLNKIFKNIHIKSELRTNFLKNCNLSKNERKDRNLSSGLWKQQLENNIAKLQNFYLSQNSVVPPRPN